MYSDTATERLFLARGDHDVHADPLARLNADSDPASATRYPIEGGREALRMGFEILDLEEIVAFVHAARDQTVKVVRCSTS